MHSSFISSDNKGYAQLQFETLMNGNDVMPGKVWITYYLVEYKWFINGH